MNTVESCYVMALLAKICLCGDGQVGKTSLKDKYLGHGFQSDYKPTLGSDFASKKVRLRIKTRYKTIRFQIWDLAGQPAFNQVRALYYNHAVGAFLIFDITRPNTMYNLEKWINELSRHSGSPNIYVIVLGNKIDLKKKKENSIDIKTARKFITDQLVSKYDSIDEKIKYFETSAKSGKNVGKAFKTLGTNIYRYYSL
ncbi:MAG: Rab family GTPase [Candidatus Hodarchaeota archaeon]